MDNERDEEYEGDIDQDYIQEAMKLALKARGRTSPNPMVGAVIVKDNKVVGEGYHQSAGLAHAEVNALLQAGPSAKGATMYLNLEPCSHYGKTPPCTKAIIKAGIKRVVIPLLDPNPLVAGVEELRENGVEVDVIGLLEDKAKEINEAYLKYITTNLPFVTLKLAITLDGKITLPQERWISGEKSRQLVHQFRSYVDAVMVGRGTVLVDDPMLTSRIEGGKDPLVIIVDSRLSIPTNSRVLQNPARVIMATTSLATEERRAAFEQLGARILLINEINGEVEMKDLMLKLGQISITNILIEGGSRVTAAVLRAGMADKILFFIAPKIAGKNERDAVAILDKTIKIKDMTVTMVGADILVTGYVEQA